MRELLRGYASAVLDVAISNGQAQRVAEDLKGFAAAVRRHDQLQVALTDSTIPSQSRRAIVQDLLGPRAHPSSVRLVSYAVMTERASELVASFEWLGRKAEEEASRQGPEPVSEPPAGRSAIRDRAIGFATAIFEDMREAIGEVEDELFRFARVIEADQQLRHALTDADLPVGLRQEIVLDILRARAHPATLRLATYAVRAGRPRDVIAVIDWMVEQAAAERNMRIAEVRSAIDLDDELQRRLASALGGITDRQVELRLSVDRSLIGGLVALVGDTVVDGSLSSRLEVLRASLASAFDVETGDQG